VTRRGRLAAPLALVALASSACEKEPAHKPESTPPGSAPAKPVANEPQRDDGPPWPADPPPFPGERFTWMKEAFAGWRHVSSETPEYRLPEITCGGTVLFDADGDGDLDVLLVSGGAWKDLTPGAKFPGHALFLNDGGFKFRDVAKESGLFGADGSYCMGAAAADYDGDGDQDLYVTALAGNFLYRNDGVKGGVPRFTECSEQAGVKGSGKWSSSACFLDADRDGRLDLYVCNYVEFSIEGNRRLKCGTPITGVGDYCSPKNFSGVQDFFFHNEGDGKFKECAVAVGLKATEPLSDNAKGLGVVASDVDADGDPDLYVSNDGCPNFLFLNDGHGKFTENGVVRGCAYSENGQSQAGMGVDAADVDGDGDFDLWVTNLDVETNGLYLNDGKGWFTESVRASGLAAADQGQVGFGTDFFDHDDDGDLDLAIANGHVLVNVHKTRGTLYYKQADQLFENLGNGRFKLLPPQESGAFFQVRNAARGLATGDLDGDGDLDLVIVRRDEGAVALRNNHVEELVAKQKDARRSDSILLRLRGRDANRDAIGALVRVTAGGRTRIEEVRAGNSFASRSDLRLHFGTGTAKSVDSIEVRWPDGATTRHGPLDPGCEYALDAGGGTAKLRELAPAAK
jgi:hypothetical protein